MQVFRSQLTSNGYAEAMRAMRSRGPELGNDYKLQIVRSFKPDRDTGGYSTCRVSVLRDF